MFFKPILYLVLFIAIGALGANYIADGFFGFKDKSKAQGMVEFSRDTMTAMSTYKADNPGSLSPVTVVDTVDTSAPAGQQTADHLGAAIVDDTDTDANEVSYDNVFGLLSDTNVNFLEGNGDPEFGQPQLSIVSDGVNDHALMVVSSIEISDGICDKINEVLGNDVPVGSNEVDVTAAALPTGSGEGILGTALTAIDGRVTNVAEGTIEGICLEDTGGNLNTFVFHLQQL